DRPTRVPGGPAGRGAPHPPIALAVTQGIAGRLRLPQPLPEFGVLLQELLARLRCRVGHLALPFAGNGLAPLATPGAAHAARRTTAPAGRRGRARCWTGRR